MKRYIISSVAESRNKEEREEDAWNDINVVCYNNDHSSCGVLSSGVLCVRLHFSSVYLHILMKGFLFRAYILFNLAYIDHKIMYYSYIAIFVSVVSHVFLHSREKSREKLILSEALLPSMSQIYGYLSKEWLASCQLNFVARDRVSSSLG